MAFAPIEASTVIRLYQDIPENGALAFSSIQNREAFFNKKLVYETTNATMVKTKNSSIVLEVDYATAHKCNYISYVNPIESDVVVYAKCFSPEYESPMATRLRFEVDEFLTALPLSHTVPYSTMIEREHLDKETHRRSMENPQSDDIIELRTSEDLVLSDEMYTVTNTGNSEYGTQSVSIPNGEDLTPNFVLQLAPFELTGKKTKSENTVKKELDAIDKKYKLGAHLDVKAPSFDENPVDFTAYSLGTLTTKYNPLTNVVDGLLGTEITDTLYHKFLQLGVDPEKLEAWQNERKLVLDKAKNGESVDYFEDFIAKYSEFTKPDMGLSAPISTYNLFLPQNSENATKLQNIIDWLTIKMVSASILGLTILPQLFKKSYPKIYTITNPAKSRYAKLMTGPFSFVRVMSPSGEKAEFFYHNFTNDKNKQYRFALLTNMSGEPVMSLAPVNYLQSTTDGSLSISIDNRIDFSSFPTVAVKVDKYFQFLAGQNQAAILNRNLIHKENYFINKITAGIGGGKNVVNSLDQLTPSVDTKTQDLNQPTGVTPGLMGVDLAGNVITGVMDMGHQYRLGKESEHRENFTLGDVQLAKNTSHASKLWNDARGAFVQDDYRPSSATGWLPYVFGGMRFRLDFVYVNQQYLPRFERYFDLYGYKSTRIGIPHVIQWMKKGIEEPQWSEIDGFQTTYIKTDGIKFKSIDLESAITLQRLFDSGIRVINGDHLLSIS